MAATEYETMSLSNIGGGGAVEKFDDELKKVIENILDLNTGDGARSITLKCVIKPDRNRDVCQVGVTVTSKLMSVQPFGTSIHVGVDPKLGYCAVEPQMTLFTKKPPETTNLVEFTKNPGKEAGKLKQV